MPSYYKNKLAKDKTLIICELYCDSCDLPQLSDKNTIPCRLCGKPLAISEILILKDAEEKK